MARTEYTETETVVTVAAFKRLANTRNGNPRYTFTDDTGKVWRSEPDAMGVGACTLDQYDAPGKRVRLHVNPAGRWTAAEYDTETPSVAHDIGHGHTLMHVNQTAVHGVRVSADTPRNGVNADGYGRKVPTRYSLHVGGRWRRVYAIAQGNSGSLYVVINSRDCFVGTVTEHFLECARDRGVGEYDRGAVDSWRGELSCASGTVQPIGSV